MDAVRIQAEFIVASSTRILRPGQLLIQSGRILEVTKDVSQPPDVDLGAMAILPGLINPHTHLEFSHLKEPFPPGENFPDWIASVVRWRNALDTETSPPSQAISTGLMESFASGTVLLGDIVSRPWQQAWLPPPSNFRHCPSVGQTITSKGVPLDADIWSRHLATVAYPRLIVFPELIGLQRERLRSSCRWAEELAAEMPGPLVVHFGLSPHAPYSLRLPKVQPTLNRFPEHTVAMHVAESRDELEWLQQASGAFGRAFERLGIPVDIDRPSIEECIAVLGQAKRGLLVHGNYLNAAQIAGIARHPNLSVVYCPRTHAHFSHSAYPLEALRSAGIRVVIGTDSLASNPDLKLWDEVSAVARSGKFFSPSDLFDAVTSGPAQALGVWRNFGSLETGKLALANIVPCAADWTVGNLLESLTATTTATLKLRPLAPSLI